MPRTPKKRSHGRPRKKTPKAKYTPKTSTNKKSAQKRNHVGSAKGKTYTQSGEWVLLEKAVAKKRKKVANEIADKFEIPWKSMKERLSDFNTVWKTKTLEEGDLILGH